jgi:peptide/nickel transport system permease protein
MSRLPLLIGRRVWQLLPIVIFATLVVFFLLQLVPGDPAVTLAGD